MDRLPTRVRATVVAVVPVVRHYVLPLDITSSQVEYITLVCAHEVLIRSPHRSLNLDPLWKIFVISFLDNLSFSSHNFYNPVVDIATVEQRNNWTNSFQGIIIIIFFFFPFYLRPGGKIKLLQHGVHGVGQETTGVSRWLWRSGVVGREQRRSRTKGVGRVVSERGLVSS